MTKRWHRIWFVGNGGMECHVRFVYRSPDYLNTSTVEGELGPLPSGARSVHWREEIPPPKTLSNMIDSVQNEIYALQEELCSLRILSNTKKEVHDQE